MNNVTDFLAYRESRNKVQSLLAAANISKLGYGELTTLVESLGKLVEQQSDVLQAMMSDLILLVQRHEEMQQQFVFVSGQAYLALNFLKEKGICTPEEVETAWQNVVQEKILKSQEQQESSSDETATTESVANESN
jgi:hypothetical protein